jgi:hypothetical protein
MARLIKPRTPAVTPGSLPAGDPDPGDLGRCDNDCPAAAVVLVEREADVLAFCGHHYDRVWPVLFERGWEVVRDLRSTLISG